MPPPNYPAKPAPAKKRGSCLSMMLALTFWSGVVGLAFVMLPGVFPQFVLGGAAVCLGILGFHYVVWGRWMKKLLEQQRAELEDNQ